MFQPGFYKQGNRLLQIYDSVETLSVLDHSTGRHYFWDKLPSDCEYLSHRYASEEVQQFVKANPQG